MSHYRLPIQFNVTGLVMSTKASDQPDGSPCTEIKLHITRKSNLVYFVCSTPVEKRHSLRRIQAHNFTQAAALKRVLGPKVSR